jgi:soluble lytic murein transglycosylase-like protein
MSILGSLLGGGSNRPEPSETMQSNAGGLMSKFNPFNLVSGMFGGRKAGAADNYAKTPNGMRKGLKESKKKDPKFVSKTPRSDMPVQKGESVTDIAAKLYGLIKRNDEKKKKELQIEENFAKSFNDVKEKRNQQLIAALTTQPVGLKKETKNLKKDSDKVKKETKDIKGQVAKKEIPKEAPKPSAQPPGAAPKPSPQPPAGAAPKPGPSAAPAPKPAPSSVPAGPRPTIPSTATKIGVGAGLAGTATATLAMPSESVANVIQKAAKTVGVDVSLMYAIAKQESGFNPAAAAKTSSAKGLYQFIKETWQGMVKTYGSKYPILKERSPTDPEANALAGALYIKENSDILSKANIPINATTVYAAHFLGSGGAKKLLSSNPNEKAADVLPSAANANKFIFYKPGDDKKPDVKKPRSIQEVINVLFEKVGKYQDIYAAELSKQGVGTKLAEKSTENKDLRKQQAAAAGGPVVVNQTNNIVASADNSKTMTVPRSDASTFARGAAT